jgi:hypothetical protein
MINRWSGGANLAAMILVAAMTPVTLADVLVSNFAEEIRAATPIGNNPNPTDPPGGGPWYWAAQSFATDGAPYQLISIEVIAGAASTTPPPVVVAELHADRGGAIDLLITTLTAPSLDGALGARTFVPDVSVTLDPDTPYWVVMGSQVPGDGTYELAYANSNNYVGSGSIGFWADSSDSGLNWKYQFDFPYFIQVNVTPGSDEDGDGVPDPLDVCCNTPPGVAVDAEGRPIGDLDLDCDNDLQDYAIYTTGFTGPLAPPTCAPVILTD